MTPAAWRPGDLCSRAASKLCAPKIRAYTPSCFVVNATPLLPRAAGLPDPEVWGSQPVCIPEGETSLCSPRTWQGWRSPTLEVPCGLSAPVHGARPGAAVDRAFWRQCSVYLILVAGEVVLSR